MSVCKQCKEPATRFVFSVCEACAPGAHVVSAAIGALVGFAAGVRRIGVNYVARSLKVQGLRETL